MRSSFFCISFAGFGNMDFIASFTQFVNSYEIPFIKEGNLFKFPEFNFSVLLEPLQHVEANSSNEFQSNGDFLYLYEDRWYYNSDIVKQRIMARLGKFRSVFARKCNVVMVEGENCREAKSGKLYYGISDRDIKSFIERYHSYGYAKSKYRYALVYNDKIIAAAAFSASRPIPREIVDEKGSGFENGGKRVFDSYEWVRYVSLPDVRVVGGMGRLLKAFLNDIASRRRANLYGVSALSPHKSVNPIEVMSYSDEEWSAGDVYRSLGFREVAKRVPVEYYVDKESYERLSLRKLMIREKSFVKDGVLPADIIASRYYTIKNRGSRKFLLQLP